MNTTVKFYSACFIVASLLLFAAPMYAQQTEQTNWSCEATIGPTFMNMYNGDGLFRLSVPASRIGNGTTLVSHFIQNQIGAEFAVSYRKNHVAYASFNRYELARGASHNQMEVTMGANTDFISVGYRYRYFIAKLAVGANLGYSYRNLNEIFMTLERRTRGAVFEYRNHGLHTGIQLQYPLLKWLHISTALQYNYFLLSNADHKQMQNAVKNEPDYFAGEFGDLLLHQEPSRRYLLFNTGITFKWK